MWEIEIGGNQKAIRIYECLKNDGGNGIDTKLFEKEK
jgi:hypothetical protein